MTNIRSVLDANTARPLCMHCCRMSCGSHRPIAICIMPSFSSTNKDGPHPHDSFLRLSFQTTLERIQLEMGITYGYCCHDLVTCHHNARTWMRLSHHAHSSMCFTRACKGRLSRAHPICLLVLAHRVEGTLPEESIPEYPTTLRFLLPEGPASRGHHICS